MVGPKVSDSSLHVALLGWVGSEEQRGLSLTSGPRCPRATGGGNSPRLKVEAVTFRESQVSIRLRRESQLRALIVCSNLLRNPESNAATGPHFMAIKSGSVGVGPENRIQKPAENPAHVSRRN